jgi:hypothetical protein
MEKSYNEIINSHLEIFNVQIPEETMDRVMKIIGDNYREMLFFKYMELVVDDMDTLKEVFEEKLEILEMIEMKLLGEINYKPTYTEDPDDPPVSNDFRVLEFTKMEMLSANGTMLFDLNYIIMHLKKLSKKIERMIQDGPNILLEEYK